MDLRPEVFRPRLTHSILRFVGLPAGIFPETETEFVDFSARSLSFL